MKCPACEAEVAEGQKFCHECGALLRGVTDPTEPLDVLAHHAAGPVEPAEVVGDVEPAAETDGDQELDATGLPASWASATGDDPASGDPADGVRDEADDDADDGTDHDTGQPASTEAVMVGAAGEIDSTDLWATRTGAVPVAAEDESSGLTGEPLTITTRDSGGVATVTSLGAAADVDAELDTAVDATDVNAATTAVVTDPAADPAAATTGGVATTVVERVDAGAPQGRWVGGQWIPGQWVDGQWVDRPESEVYLLPSEGFRVRPAFVLAVLALLATLLAAVADVSGVTTDRVVDGIPNQVFTLDSLGSNLAVAGFVGAAVMLIGALLQCFGLRWGGGLTGGAGLATAGWASLTIGLAEIGLFRAQLVLDNPEVPPFTLTITRDVGYFLVLGVGVIGVLVALFSLASAGRGGRPGLNPWVAACGALASTIVVAGPLIPAGDFGFDVNFSNAALPWQFYTGRTIHLALLLLGGVIGFLLVRTYGLGLAAGTMCVAVWLWISSLIDVGGRSFGIGGFNIGTADTSPHAVTTVGVVATVLFLVVAAVLATLQNRRT
ncbi:MAG: zinc ribbon domain-containing protein [Actinomycetota bacterium]